MVGLFRVKKKATSKNGVLSLPHFCWREDIPHAHARKRTHTHAHARTHTSPPTTTRCRRQRTAPSAAHRPSLFTATSSSQGCDPIQGPTPQTAKRAGGALAKPSVGTADIRTREAMDGYCGWLLWMATVDGYCGWLLWMGIALVEYSQAHRRNC